MLNTKFSSPLVWLWPALWFGIVLVLVSFHVGFCNFDATKYTAITMNMLNNHEYILPYFQGQPYSDKGPLMFWLFAFGWKLFGIHLWWPQLVMALFSTATILLTIYLGTQLWPNEKNISFIVPYILIGFPTWIAITAEIRVDIILMFFSFVGLVSLLKVAEGKKLYWLLYTIAIAGGALCKGPTILIYTFGPALFLPWLWKREKIKLFSWYASLLLATIVGLSLLLFWLIPVAYKGGQAYLHSILFGQIASRALLHYSYFYYLTHLSYLLIPWILYIPVLKGLIKGNSDDNYFGEKFCSLIIVLSLVIFSFYGQKRLHYINPDFPIFALLISHALSNFIQSNLLVKKGYQFFIGIGLILCAIAILFLPYVPVHGQILQQQISYLNQYRLYLSFVILLVAMVYFFYRTTLFSQILLLMLPFVLMTTTMAVYNRIVFEKHDSHSVQLLLNQQQRNINKWPQG